MVKYKSETYKGAKITFSKMNGGMVGARVPKRTSQYLGVGKSKKEAFADIKDTIDKIDKAGNW
ncbi:MAG: hypothetical protein ACOCP8_09105 [archaeon]